MRSCYLWPFYWKLLPSWVRVESPGLENIPQVLADRAELGQNYDARKAVSATFSVLKWFSATSARFSRILAIFSSPGDSKLTPDNLGLMWNGRRKTFWTLSFELLGRNTTVLHFKTEIVAETSLRASWFWPSSARFPGTWGIFSSPGDFKLTPDGLGLQLNAQSVTF